MAMADANLPVEWRPMTAEDLLGISELSNRVHINYPERLEILQEKFALFPAGCFTLAGTGMAIRGYCFSHPWSDGAPPSLDTFLGTLPEWRSSYFIHDLTLDPSVQGRRLAVALLPRLIAVAERIATPRMALVAVNGSEPFWTRMGFGRTDDAALQAAARSKYDDAVHMQRALI